MGGLLIGARVATSEANKSVARMFTMIGWAAAAAAVFALVFATAPVVVVAVAALVVFGLFGDTIKKKMSGAVSSLDEDLGSQAQSEVGTSSAETLRNLDAEGVGN